MAHNGLAEIDALLEQRHDLTGSQGELRDPRDIASSIEWGTAG